MKKTAGLVVLGVALCWCSVSMAATQVAGPGAEGAVTAAAEWTEDAACQASMVHDVPAASVQKSTISGLPACPTTSLTCVGGSTSEKCRGSSFCRAGSVTQLIDTGNTQCDDNGTTVTCGPGKTIQIKQIPCSQCPCCSQQPACLCPNDCGSIRSWGCG